MKELLLTLGHNSSAIFMEDGVVVDGWENERITGFKSDSQMPFVEGLTEGVDAAYVTHWSPDGVLNNMGHKYWKPEWLDKVPVVTLSTEVTHHDTHMAAAQWYAGPDFPYDDRTYGLVIDGFGTFGEHISVYKLGPNGHRTLQRRVHGYNTSLGLLYQYATAFMGMKMHEDEYKLLGYEVLVPPELVDALGVMTQIWAIKWTDLMAKSVYGSRYDPVFSLNALLHTKTSVFDLLGAVCKKFNVTDVHSQEGRSILAFFVQSLLEAVVLELVDDLDCKNLILSGGVFYNVKLNHKLLNHVWNRGGKLCVYPLAGDQGNALGLWKIHDGLGRLFPDTLCWGLRDLKDVGHVRNLHVFSSEYEASSFILTALKDVGYVNLVRGNMEFGPRALCNTSTLALPTRGAVAEINAANNRNTVMPMAPVMTRSMYESMFHCTGNVWKSEQHMIVAMQYRDLVLSQELMGIAHGYKYPFEYYTGRPQVIDERDNLMDYILTEVGHPLINTSFNFHGRPIAFGMESIVANHMLQLGRNPNFRTVVLQNV